MLYTLSRTQDARARLGELSEEVYLPQPSLSRLVDRLVADGLVSRSRGADARSRLLCLTRAGQGRADRILALRDDALGRTVGHLDEDDRRELERLLTLVVGGLAEDHPTALTVCRLCDRDACAEEPGCPLDHTTPRRARRSRSTRTPGFRSTRITFTSIGTIPKISAASASRPSVTR